MQVNNRILKNIEEIGLKSQKVELKSVKVISDARQELEKIYNEVSVQMQSALSTLDQATRKSQDALDKITDVKGDIDTFIDKVNDLGVDLPDDVKVDITQIEALESIFGNAASQLDRAQDLIMDSQT